MNIFVLSSLVCRVSNKFGRGANKGASAPGSTKSGAYDPGPEGECGEGWVLRMYAWANLAKTKSFFSHQPDDFFRNFTKSYVMIFHLNSHGMIFNTIVCIYDLPLF